MKNRTITLFVFFAFTATGVSQSILKNKLAIVYDLNYNPKSYLDENNGIRELGIRETLNQTNFEHSLTLNYKVLSKLSVSLSGGFHSQNITYVYDPFEEFEESKISSISYGVGLNIFFKKGLAPSDSHLGFYIKNHNYKINESDVVAALYSNRYSNGLNYISDLNASGDMKLDMTLIGIKYVYTRMITKTLPVYWNIGINYTVPIIKKTTYSEVDFETGNINYIIEPELDQDLQFEYYRDLHRFRINLGLGYIF